MTDVLAKEIAANLDRADQSIRAAKELANKGFFDFAASRAYYGAFYAAIALLLNDGIERSKHSGVIALIHQKYVKQGKLSKDVGKGLNLLFEMRNVGDYGGIAHLTGEEAKEAIEAATLFLNAIHSLIGGKP